MQRCNNFFQTHFVTLVRSDLGPRKSQGSRGTAVISDEISWDFTRFLTLCQCVEIEKSSDANLREAEEAIAHAGLGHFVLLARSTAE